MIECCLDRDLIWRAASELEAALYVNVRVVCIIDERREDKRVKCRDTGKNTSQSRSYTN